jgi:site-specific DNA-cytosine methylase
LSPTAAAGILKRAGKRGRPLPPHLRISLEVQAAKLPPKEAEPEPEPEPDEMTLFALPEASAPSPPTPTLPDPSEPSEGPEDTSRISTQPEPTSSIPFTKMHAANHANDHETWREAEVARCLAGGELAHTSGATGAAVAEPTAGVRRLTPTECERLQGFPDGWTIP